MNQSTESSEPTFTVAEEQAPITARSGSGVTHVADRSGAASRSNAETPAAPLTDVPEERGFFADGEIGRYLGGPEEFADAGSFSETMAERPASQFERWTSLAVVLAVAGAVAGGTVVATGWLDSWLGKGRQVELAAVNAASASERGNPNRDEAEGAAEPEAVRGASTSTSPNDVPGAVVPPVEPTDTAEAAASGDPAAANSERGDPVQGDPVQGVAEQPAAAAAAATDPAPSAATQAPVEAPKSPVGSTAVAASQGSTAAPREQTKPRAEAAPPRLRSAEIATPRPASPSVKKSFAPSPAKQPAAPTPPAKKPSVVSFPTN